MNMAEQSKHSIDPKSGFCSETKTFHSLRNKFSLPPPNLSLSFSDYSLTLLRLSSAPDTPLLTHSSSSRRLSRDHLIRRSENLAASLRHSLPSLSKGDCAIILSPSSPRLPILFFALLSLGVVVSPLNPLATDADIRRVVSLCRPAIAFATNSVASSLELPDLRLKTVVIDSPEFEAMEETPAPIGKPVDRGKAVKQGDTAAILWTSGTTGEPKGAELSHRNLTAALSALNADRPETEKAAEAVVLYPVPMYHSYGFVSCLKSLATGEKVVLTEETELPEILKLVGQFGATQVSLAPPLVAFMAKSDDRHDADATMMMMDGCDLATLKVVACGGLSLGKSVVQTFRSRFPNLLLAQGYGLTETCGVAFRPRCPIECDRFGSAGRLVANCEAKIVDPSTGLALPPCSRGELWIRGPMVMKGYVGDKQGSSSKALDSEGWLRTGDYCYIDSEGYLFVLDKLQDLIKYKDHLISPGQLEEVLSSHPDIIDVVVIPFKGEEEASEVPMALVVKRPESSIDEMQITSFVAKQVEEYKKIRKVSFVDSIPRNPMGKASRKNLSKLFSS